MAMKWKRSSPGHYASGDIEIKKGIGIDSDKWWIYFPDGKASYRRSYEAAKSWAEKYYEPDLTDDDTDIFLAAMQAIAEVNELLATLEV